jgi:hypothetical protein
MFLFAKRFLPELERDDRSRGVAAVAARKRVVSVVLLKEQ